MLIYLYLYLYIYIYVSPIGYSLSPVAYLLPNLKVDGRYGDPSSEHNQRARPEGAEGESGKGSVRPIPSSGQQATAPAKYIGNRR